MLSYADDVVAILKDDRSVRETFKEYERLFLASGLKLNGSKTECLCLGAIPPPSLTISYLNESIILKVVDNMKVCGNVLSLDKSICYAENITKQVSKLSAILKYWSGRNLSPNGKMIILKTFALSQLVFVSQHSNIMASDIKKIEALSYKFVWSGKPDRIKRGVLKNDKANGGINGVDIDCFLSAIKLKQYVKAEKNCELLQAIHNQPNVQEEIAISARQSMHKLYRIAYNGLDPFSEDQPSNEDIASIANLDILGFTKIGSKAEKVLLDNDIHSFAQLTDSAIPRGKMNIVLKQIPTYLKAFLINSYDLRPIRHGYFDGKRILYFDKCPTKRLQSLLKSANGKYVKPRVWNSELKVDWKRIWLIRNPTLRSIRYKVAHGDVFCNLRRLQCKVSDNDKCIICSNSETIEHQLFDCQNARRLWDIANCLLDTKIFNLMDAIEPNGSESDEIIKSVIIKLLLQIDRSKDIPTRAVLAKLKHFVQIERAVSKNYKLDIIICNIESFSEK